MVRQTFHMLQGVAVYFLVAAAPTLASQQNASFVISPRSINFGNQTVGTKTTEIVVQLTNTGATTENIDPRILPTACGIFQGVPSQPCAEAQAEEILSYSVLGNCLQLRPGQSCALAVTFAPKVARQLGASLYVQSATGFLGQANLVGTGMPGQLASGAALAIEFYNNHLDHYFITHLPGEIAKLDVGAISGWERTGYSFWVWPDLASAPPGASSACRFYGLPQAGLDSHFYTLSADECSDVIKRFGSSWIVESSDFFAAFLPQVFTGECPIQSQPIHRLYNGRADANHRYMPFRNVDWLSLRAQGWIPEGYGEDAVVMCGAPGVYAVP